MYNAKDPDQNELPSSARLLRSTVLALVGAVVLLVTFVLPAEYGIDPTGIGEAVGLKRMGEIKSQLAAEASAETLVEASVQLETAAPEAIAPEANAPAMAVNGWRDETVVPIAPDAAIELKLVMSEGDRAGFEWVTEGGALNFNLHADGGGQSIEYDKGRSVSTDAGELVAAFDGYHGWYWRNRSGNPVVLRLRTRGDYEEIKRTR
jgi:hypothetical protein